VFHLMGANDLAIKTESAADVAVRMRPYLMSYATVNQTSWP